MIRQNTCHLNRLAILQAREDLDTSKVLDDLIQWYAHLPVITKRASLAFPTPHRYTFTAGVFHAVAYTHVLDR